MVMVLVLDAPRAAHFEARPWWPRSRAIGWCHRRARVAKTTGSTRRLFLTYT